MRAKSTPEGYHSLTPFLIVEDVRAAVEFYRRVFDAEVKIQRQAEGALLLAGLLIGDSPLMISAHSNDPNGGVGGLARQNGSGLRVYVADVDETFRRAKAAGAGVLEPPQEMFWGDKVGEIVDPFGFSWKISQHLEDLESEEIERRMREARSSPSVSASA
jgi:PhnB protein